MSDTTPGETCSRCGSVAAPNARFCAACGAPLSRSPGSDADTRTVEGPTAAAPADRIAQPARRSARDRVLWAAIAVTVVAVIVALVVGLRSGRTSHEAGSDPGASGRLAPPTSGGGPAPVDTTSTSAASEAAQTTPLSVDAFTGDFSAMIQLKDLAARGTGVIGVLLPETTTSARYTSFDAPYLKHAFQKAGLSDSDVIITNAQGSDATQKTQADAAMANGATVLIVDPIDSGVGAAIEADAKAHGVKVIDYDRLTLGGSRDYYVSFDNVKVGTLIGQGFVKCVGDWHVNHPNVLILDGSPTDNNATLFAQGYNAVLKPYFDSGEYAKVGEPAGSWEPSVVQTTFTQQYTAHPNIDATVVANDANANAVISQLKTLGIKPDTFPTTGQDAQVTGLQNILTGYQCMTVYKPIYLEAQASAALALYLRAGQTPPSALVNGQTADTEANSQVPSVLLPSVSVSASNMANTVVKDNFVPASQICTTPALQRACASAGIGG